MLLSPIGIESDDRIGPSEGDPTIVLLAPRKPLGNLRLVEFIESCLIWNRSQGASDKGNPGAEQFAAFEEVFVGDPWTILTSRGEELRIEGAPNFLGLAEVSWQLLDLSEAPSAGSSG